MSKPSGVPVKVELFEVAVNHGRGIAYVVRTCDLVWPCPDPDLVARALVDEGMAREGEGPTSPMVMHSTSWRWDESGAIVLTYLALLERLSDHGQAIRRMAILPTFRASDPGKPRPAQIREEDVLAHGLHHLAFLVQQERGDPIRRALSEEARRFLDSLAPEQAGRIGSEVGGDAVGLPWGKLGVA
jgi:hypothetical protein